MARSRVTRSTPCRTQATPPPTTTAHTSKRVQSRLSNAAIVGTAGMCTRGAVERQRQRRRAHDVRRHGEYTQAAFRSSNRPGTWCSRCKQGTRLAPDALTVFASDRASPFRLRDSLGVRAREPESARGSRPHATNRRTSVAPKHQHPRRFLRAGSDRPFTDLANSPRSISQSWLPG